MVSAMIKLVPEQLEALDAIQNKKGIVRLLGGPGNGKTTVINTSNIAVKAAPTNKAASLIGAQTIHKLLRLKLQRHGTGYRTVKTQETPMFPIQDRVVFDEASCISSDLLERFIVPLVPNAVFVGDEAQLNPVGQHTIPFMDIKAVAEIRLTHCHRFGDEIFDVVSANRRAVLEGSPFTVPAHWASSAQEMLDSYQDGDIVIAWRNATVQAYNKLIKQHLYHTTEWVVGEHVRVGEYYEALRLPNESEYRITNLLGKGRTYGFDLEVIELDYSYVVPVLADGQQAAFRAALNGYARATDWSSYWGLKSSVCDLRSSFAITAHKSQGMTYKRVRVDFNDIFANPRANEAARAAYVAMSRASECVRSLV